MEFHLLANVELNYPSAREWMWDYCIYLGPWEDADGRKYDLGVFKKKDGLSAAVVYGNVPGNYMSGDLSLLVESDRPFYVETLRRAKELNLI